MGNSNTIQYVRLPDRYINITEEEVREDSEKRWNRRLNAPGIAGAVRFLIPLEDSDLYTVKHTVDERIEGFWRPHPVEYSQFTYIRCVRDN